MKRNLLILILFAIAMAWMESATVVYLRVLVGRLQPHQPDPLPLHPFYGPNLGAIEVVRELATMVMLATGGWLAGRTPRSRFGLFLVAFGIWDILYYVFLAVMGPWPRSPLDWDVLFLIPPSPLWYQPVWLPVAISSGMIAAGAVLFVRGEARAAPGAPPHPQG